MCFEGKEEKEVKRGRIGSERDICSALYFIYQLCCIYIVFKLVQVKGIADPEQLNQLPPFINQVRNKSLQLQADVIAAWRKEFLLIKVLNSACLLVA